jgi:hypothetical protein
MTPTERPPSSTSRYVPRHREILNLSSICFDLQSIFIQHSMQAIQHTWLSACAQYVATVVQVKEFYIAEMPWTIMLGRKGNFSGAHELSRHFDDCTSCMVIPFVYQPACADIFQDSTCHEEVAQQTHNAVTNLLPCATLLVHECFSALSLNIIMLGKV